MDEEKFLDRFKKEYFNTEPPQYLKEEGWQDLRYRLEQINRPFHRSKFGSWGFVYAGFVALFLFAGGFGVMQAAQAALPGDTLYPIKRLSEEVISKTTGNSQTKLGNRASEILNMAKKQQQDKQSLDKAVRDYRQTVSEIKQRGKKSSRDSVELNQNLEEQRSEFQKELDRHSSKHLEDAIKIIDEAEGDQHSTPKPDQKE